MTERIINSEIEMKQLGEEIGHSLKGGEVLELIGDVGAGKTTFTKGLAKGLGVAETVQSPSFTISRMYEAGDLTLSHYDFYRLNDAGIMAMEIASAVEDAHNITVVEWAESVAEILPESRIKIRILPQSETMRKVELEGLEL
jgi:tRNA threonylcarbamoyladenosine biosynthesis protein TsaE